MAIACLDNKINSLEKDLAIAANKLDIDMNLDTQLNKAILHSKLNYLEKKRWFNVRSKS